MDAKRTVEELHLKYCEESFDKEGILSGFEVDAPETFNFAYDVVRKIAEIEPDRRAMLWCDEERNTPLPLPRWKRCPIGRPIYFRAMASGVEIR